MHLFRVKTLWQAFEPEFNPKKEHPVKMRVPASEATHKRIAELLNEDFDKSALMCEAMRLPTLPELSQ
ncbi:MAG: hypothetical protein ACYCXT_00960 [Acidiferrobacteraceae bacterium]